MRARNSTGYDAWRGRRALRRRQGLLDACVAALPALMAGAAVVALLALLFVGGCGGGDGGDPARLHDRVRAGCASARHAFDLAVERVKTGDMSVATFRAVNTGYGEMLGLCRAVLIEGAPPSADIAGALQGWAVATQAAAAPRSDSNSGQVIP